MQEEKDKWKSTCVINYGVQRNAHSRRAGEKVYKAIKDLKWPIFPKYQVLKIVQVGLKTKTCNGCNETMAVLVKHRVATGEMDCKPLLPALSPLLLQLHAM